MGSRALAKRMADENQNVVAMFNVSPPFFSSATAISSFLLLTHRPSFLTPRPAQADMIGYAPEGDGIVLAYMNRFNDPDLTEVSREITNTYVPEVETTLTDVCCSDHQSFSENGFPSVGFFETPQARAPPPQHATRSHAIVSIALSQHTHDAAYVVSSLLPPQASVVYPAYHSSNDLLELLSPEKIFLMTKATLASTIVLAEPL